MNDFADALRLPRAHGGAVGSGLLRSHPEDFVVREWLGFEADGEGEHWLLTVRKRGANTQWVAKRLGQIANVHPRDVGFAGLKDRNAVAEQAFTVPVRSAVPNWLVVSGDGFEVVRAQRHRRKLKRGALKGNDFQIVIRDFTGDRAALATRLAVIEAAGVPNYFGPQRFGREGANLRRAVAHFTGQRVIGDSLCRRRARCYSTRCLPPGSTPEPGIASSRATSPISMAVTASSFLSPLIQGQSMRRCSNAVRSWTFIPPVPCGDAASRRHRVRCSSSRRTSHRDPRCSPRGLQARGSNRSAVRCGCAFGR